MLRGTLLYLSEQPALKRVFGGPLARHAPRALLDRPAAALRGLRTLHSGHVGDYIAWFTFAMASLGGLFALTLR